MNNTDITAFRENAIENNTSKEMKHNSCNVLKNNTFKNNLNNMNQINILMNDSTSIGNAEIKSNNANQVNPCEMDCNFGEETNNNAVRNENEGGTSSQEHLDLVKNNDINLKHEDASRLVEPDVQYEDRKISCKEFINNYYTTVASKTKKGTFSYYDEDRKEKIDLINYDNKFVTKEDAARLLELDVQFEIGKISREEFITKRSMLMEEIAKTLDYVFSPDEIYPDDFEEEGIEPEDRFENDYSDCSFPSDKYHAMIMMATDKLDESSNGDPSQRATVLNVLSNKISLKEASQLEELFIKKATMCGIGTTRVREFLNRKSIEGDKAAEILWFALNLEDRRISSLVSKEDYFSNKVIRMNQSLNSLINLIRKTGIGDYGYINTTQYTIFSSDQDSTCRTLCIDLPKGLQISFTVPSSYMVFLKPYEKEMMPSDKSNLVRIEEALNKLYGEEMRERYGSSPAVLDVTPANLLIRKHDQYVEIFERLYPNHVVRSEKLAHKAAKMIVGDVPVESENSTNSESNQQFLELVECNSNIIRLKEYDYLTELKKRYDNDEIPSQQYYFMARNLPSYIDYYYCYNTDGTQIRTHSNCKGPELIPFFIF